jgi:broad specificity phosphatase PhoE
MPRLWLIRHGHAEASFEAALDPGLSDEGKAQAEAVAPVLAVLKPQALLSSPLARARQTAAPLERLMESHARIEPGVGEIPSPGLGLSERGAWLRKLFEGRWADGGEDVMAWREGVVTALLRQTRPTAIFSHFVAINVAVGEALGDPRVMVFRPGYTSITVLETDGKSLTLIEKGAEQETIVR